MKCAKSPFTKFALKIFMLRQRMKDLLLQAHVVAVRTSNLTISHLVDWLRPKCVRACIPNPNGDVVYGHVTSLLRRSHEAKDKTLGRRFECRRSYTHHVLWLLVSYNCIFVCCLFAYLFISFIASFCECSLSRPCTTSTKSDIRLTSSQFFSFHLS